MFGEYLQACVEVVGDIPGPQTTSSLEKPVSPVQIWAKFPRPGVGSQPECQ